MTGFKVAPEPGRPIPLFDSPRRPSYTPTAMLGSTRISRYVFSEMIPPTVLGLTLYLFVLLMNHFFVVAEKALSKSLGWSLTLQLFVVGIPKLLVLAIPMSVLLGVLIAVGRLSADHEWVSMQGAGQGPMRLVRPVAMFGLMASMACAFVYGWVAPRSNFAMRNLRGEVLFASNLAADLKPRVFYTDLPDVVLYVADITKDSERRLQKVLLVDQTHPGKTELLVANTGDLYPSPDGSGNIVLDLYDGLSHRWDSSDPEDYQRIGFGSRRQTLPVAEHLKAFLAPPQKVVNDFNPLELFTEVREARAKERQVRDEMKAQGDPTVNRLYVVENRRRTAEMEFHRRLALPVASFVLALLALPLGVTRVRSGKGAGFALSLGVILLYWIVFTAGLDQAAAGTVPVWVGAWSANIVIAIWAAIAISRMGRTSEGRSPVRWLLGLLKGLAKRVGKLFRRPRSRRRDGANGAMNELESLGGTTGRFVARIDQYVTRSFLRILTFSVMSVYLIYALVQLKSLVDDVMKHGQSMSLILDYFRYFAPGVLYIVLPVSCLVGGVVTFSVLTRSGELTAIKASGVSMRRVTVPVVAMTALISLTLFLIHDKIAPSTNRKAQEIRDQIEGRGPRTYGGEATTGRWIIDPERKELYYYRYYDESRETFSELTVFTIDRDVPRILDHRFAQKARWNGDTWELKDGWYRAFPDDDRPRMTYQRSPGLEVVELAPPETFTGKIVKLSRLGDLAEQMSTKQLKVEIASMEAGGYNTTRLEMDYYTKFAQSTAPLVMVLLGLPFAFKVGRRGSMYGVGVALLLVLAYWAAFAIFTALGLEAILPPMAAAWTPNVLFGLLGIYLLLYVPT